MLCLKKKWKKWSTTARQWLYKNYNNDNIHDTNDELNIFHLLLWFFVHTTTSSSSYEIFIGVYIYPSDALPFDNIESNIEKVHVNMKTTRHRKQPFVRPCETTSDQPNENEWLSENGWKTKITPVSHSILYACIQIDVRW